MDNPHSWWHEHRPLQSATLDYVNRITVRSFMMIIFCERLLTAGMIISFSLSVFFHSDGSNTGGGAEVAGHWDGVGVVPNPTDAA